MYFTKPTELRDTQLGKSSPLKRLNSEDNFHYFNKAFISPGVQDKI